MDIGIPDSDIPDIGITGSDIPDIGIPDSDISDIGITDSDIPDIGISDSDISDIDFTDREDGLENKMDTEGESDLTDFAIEDFGVMDMPEEENEEQTVLPDISDDIYTTAEDVTGKTDGGLTDLSDENDMLALLEKMSEEAEEEAASDAGEETDKKPEEKKGKNKERKGLFSKLFSGKEKDIEKDAENGTESRAEAQTLESGVSEQESQNLNELAGLFQPEGQEDVQSDREGEDKTEPEQEADAVMNRKKGFFSKIIAFLTETDDDGKDSDAESESGMKPSDENKNILNELDEEDKKKKKKKVKGSKMQPEDSLDDEEDETEGAGTAKKKKGKKKKDKLSAAEPVIEPVTKPVKKISKKNIAIITGLCLTLTAMIIVMCSIVPEFFDKRKARDAYYQSDFSKSYELLYGRKLDNSDTIIFNKSRIILELNRKIDSYHNYLAIGKEVQALDALMSGVQKYPDILLEAEEYHVTQEVNAIYETVLNILNDKYDISEPVAKVINDYDDLTYTRKLESLVNHTPFVKPEEEQQADTGIPDILPEEQVLLEENMEIGTDGADTSETLAENTSVPDGGERSDGEETNGGETADGEETNGTGGRSGAGTQEEELPIDDSGSTQQEMSETTPQQTAAVTAPQQEETEQETPSETVPQSGGSSSRGQMIQGIRQPIDVEIHEN